LRVCVHQAAELTDDVLAGACETVRDWRRWLAAVPVVPEGLSCPPVTPDPGPAGFSMA
jgi:hypothetical protein